MSARMMAVMMASAYSLKVSFLLLDLPLEFDVLPENSPESGPSPARVSLRGSEEASSMFFVSNALSWSSIIPTLS